MAEAKKVLKEVVCCHNPEHVFTIAVALEPGSKGASSTIEAYCPLCDKFVSVTIQGAPELNEQITRLFKRP